jgi:small GTP-binding protein
LDFLPSAKVPSSQNLQVPLFFHQGTFSKIAAYEFTTLTCIPGVLQYKGSKIQLLDLPGIIEGAKDGKGRGKQVIAVARTCNLIIIVLDSTRPMQHKKIIEHELEGFGIRLNKSPPDIEFKKKDKGGITISRMVDSDRVSD